MDTQDEKLMKQALVVARRGLSKVEPNPAVGALLSKAGQIIGKGWHKEFGGPHAEINALEDCASLGVNPQGATLYVTLEPCCHEGKTGPCTEAIIKAGIQQVIVATKDPARHANGAGLKKLREAGIKVEIGCCEREARLLNAPFFKHATEGKPWIVLKWAQSLDGCLARKNQTEKEDQWISSKASRSDAHRLRRRTQAILVGINTVITDNPKLTPRPSKGKTPLRIVLDNTLRIPLKSRVIRSAKTQPTLIVTTAAAANDKATRLESIQNKGVEVLVCPDTTEQTDLNYLIETLGQRGIQQLLVEGGSITHAAFLEHKLMDEICMYLASTVMGISGSTNTTQAFNSINHQITLENIEAKPFDGDIRWTGYNQDSIAKILSI